MRGGQGPGAGAQRGPSLRRVTEHKGDNGEAAAGADLRSPATRNCGYRPAAPPPPPGPPARLSVSSLPPYWTAPAHFRAPGIWHRLGPGTRSRWSRRGRVVAAGQLGRQPGASGTVSRCFGHQPLPARPVPFSGLRALPAGLCAASGAAAALGAPAVAWKPALKGQPGPRPNMAEVSIDQSKLPGVKEGKGRGGRARGTLPSRSPRFSQVRGVAIAAPAALARRPSCVGLAWT